MKQAAMIDHTIVRGSVARLLQAAVERTPIEQHDGKSGATLERAILADGTRLVIKRLSPEHDLVMRGTHDTGRAAQLWLSGVLDRIPPVIEHGTLAAERDGDGWLLAMRDLSEAMLPNERVLSRAEYCRVLEAAAALHATFRGERIEGLCSVADHLALLAPGHMARELPSGEPIPRLAVRGWELFPEAVPRDVAEAIAAIHERPHLLAEELERSETTLLHGDLWLANLGFLSDRVVVLDWGLATQGPPALEFTFALAGNWSRVAASREQLIDDFRAAYGERHDERALQLAFLAALAEMGWNKALDAVEHPDPAIRAREAGDLEWWVRRVRASLEGWSPM